MDKKKLPRFKRHRDYGFFDQDIRLSKLSELGDPLERLSNGIDFGIFNKIIVDEFQKTPTNKGGRPPYDYGVMFKILILQRYYNLSDDQTEYQINDRMSFMRFLGFTMADDIPDSKTIWHFREKIAKLGLVEKLFDAFLSLLKGLGLIVNEGKIVDATFVEVPVQRNSRAENKEIKAGMIPESFAAHPRKLSQKDTDARWVTKNGEDTFGYKNHVCVDSKSKIITGYDVTSASVHDSQQLEAVLLSGNNEGQELYADSAYVGKEGIIENAKMTNRVHEKGYRNRPLTEEQVKNNHIKSKTRARVEHVFAFIENNMNSIYLQVIGMARIKASIGLMNLTYNMFRKIQLS